MASVPLLSVLLSLVVLLAVVLSASGSSCSYSCTKYKTAYKSCGCWGWGRCSYRKSYSSTCSKYCRHGGWTSWTTYSYSTCSKTCGTGYRYRYQKRSCTNPRPYNGGKSCYGSSTKSVRESCNTRYCPIHGGWSSWSSSVSSGACSRSCGRGYQTRKYKRTCTKPVPKNGGRQCSGDNAQTIVSACNTQSCPINGGWSCWTTTTGSCSKTCGRGVRVLTDKRTCTNPAPQYKGTACSGSSTRTRNEICNNRVRCDNTVKGYPRYRWSRARRVYILG
ncbi:coadhesin-like isoform X3 [Littorina saxatilis]|uniref:coadhesin-like isoform X3 n=1 Tax=Littorina saxatilis TaxID=31220 RepID=UPI0038B53969